MKKETNSETRTCDYCGKQQTVDIDRNTDYFNDWFVVSQEKLKYLKMGETARLDGGVDFCCSECMIRYCIYKVTVGTFKESLVAFLKKFDRSPEAEPFPHAQAEILPQAPPTPYAWLITKDHVADKEASLMTNSNSLGAVGPCGITQAQIDLLVGIHLGISADDSTIRFRMYDDDNILYYEGIMIGKYTELEPLDDFGMPNAGCTRIDTYNTKTGNWETV